MYQMYLIHEFKGGNLNSNIAQLLLDGWFHDNSKLCLRLLSESER